MTTFIADDFAFIAARAKELRDGAFVADAALWWCDDCQKEIRNDFVAFSGDPMDIGIHNEAMGGCGCNVYPVCTECENSGWVLSGYQPRPPNFDVCPKCYNPNDRRSP